MFPLLRQRGFGFGFGLGRLVEIDGIMQKRKVLIAPSPWK
ncbi:hypothetical protein BRPE64_ACDS10070 [Caballeronia insecticola]|uniref:Uncharacterized protein n=1 Tax=Caballeronia insecticola TaxID=758793 RepID=R4WV29_9BURK|nr:hypothetical protein BRPE64_ACDS10070 [Caballeronia insecticola]